MAKKSNVHLKTVEHIYGLSGAQPCGHLSADEMNDLIEQIKNAKIPFESCIISMSVDLSQYFCNMKIFKLASKSEHLTINLNTCKKCGIHKQIHCPKQIASGKCQEEIVIDLIGKKLFADKYNQGK